MEYQAAKAHKAKAQKSLLKTMERYQGTIVLINSWEEAGEPDTDYLRSLRAKATKLRTQLKMKGFMLE